MKKVAEQQNLGECKNCKFYQEVSGSWGYCKFNAPVIITKHPDTKEWPWIESTWPKVFPEDWCGQFKWPCISNGLEQLTCNETVIGSNPILASKL